MMGGVERTIAILFERGSSNSFSAYGNSVNNPLQSLGWGDTTIATLFERGSSGIFSASPPSYFRYVTMVTA